MDTRDARRRMLQLATQAVAAIERYQAGDLTGVDPVSEIRGLQGEARSVLADAGYPGEAVWQALTQAHFGFEAYMETPDSPFWVDLLDRFRAAIVTLDGLLGSAGGQEADFRIIGG